MDLGEIGGTFGKEEVIRVSRKPLHLDECSGKSSFRKTLEVNGNPTCGCGSCTPEGPRPGTLRVVEEKVTRAEGHESGRTGRKSRIDWTVGGGYHITGETFQDGREKKGKEKKIRLGVRCRDGLTGWYTRTL